MEIEELIEIDFENFEEEYKLIYTGNKPIKNSSLIFIDKNNNELTLVKIKSKNNLCTNCMSINKKLISVNSIKIIEEKYRLKLLNK